MVRQFKTAPRFPHCKNMAVPLITWLRIESIVAVENTKHGISFRACTQDEEGGARLAFLRGELT